MNSFRFRFGLASLLAALVCASFTGNAREKKQEPPPTIRVSVERVNVGVIVSDSSGHFVEGLRLEDFQIFDNEVEQPVAGFATIAEPAQVLLLIEAGPAVYLLQSAHLRAAHALLDGLSPGDRVAVVKYAEAPQALLEFTADKQAAGVSFERLSFNLGFGSLNLSSSLWKVLESIAKLQGKKTIVLLSTGVDTSTPEESAAVLQRLRISDVRLLAVSLMGGLQNPPPSGKKKASAAIPSQTAQQFEQANQLLKLMAEASGGRAYFPMSSKEFDAVYAEIAQLVRHEYSLAFAPAGHDGQVHSIRVSVKGPGRRVDHRQAYMVPAPEKP